MPPVCPRGWVLIESPEINGPTSQYLHKNDSGLARSFLPLVPNYHLFATDSPTRTPASRLWQYTLLKTAFVISKNWNLRKSANYFNFIKRWKVACVAGGFVCERTNERQRFLSRFRSRRQQNRQLQGYWKANDNTESTRRANSNINSLQVFLVAFLPSSKFVAMMISIHDYHHYYLSYFWSRDDQMELLYIIFFLLCLLKSSVSGEIGDVISGKLSVPEEKTKIFKSLGKWNYVQPRFAMFTLRVVSVCLFL